jgi:hypothetical protein
MKRSGIPRRCFLVCWKRHEFEFNVGQGWKVNDSIGSQIAHKKRGDRLFICGTDGHEVYLGGVFDIERIVPVRDTTYGSHRAFGRNRSGAFVSVPLGALKWKLRFISNVSDRLNRRYSLVHQLRQHRELDDQSARALMRLMSGKANAFSTWRTRQFVREGRTLERSMTVWERNARRYALQAHGYRCKVCMLDFGSTYGARFRDCVHVHHLNLRKVRGARGLRTYIQNDVIVVCPNCHAALHRSGNPGNWRQFKRECGFDE